MMKISFSVRLPNSQNMRLREDVEFNKNCKLETLRINLMLKIKIAISFFFSSMMFSV